MTLFYKVQEVFWARKAYREGSLELNLDGRASGKAQQCRQNWQHGERFGDL